MEINKEIKDKMEKLIPNFSNLSREEVFKNLNEYVEKNVNTQENELKNKIEAQEILKNILLNK